MDSYGLESHEREDERVRLAVLKLADGDAEKAVALVAAAKTDYRDVLMWAEYPGEALASHGEVSSAVRLRDREQYEAWLRKLR